jgi:hypothetical protein
MKLYNYPLIAPFDDKLDLKLVSLKAQQVTCDRGTRKTIFRSVIVYIKKLSSHCDLLGQIKQAQDKGK